VATRLREKTFTMDDLIQQVKSYNPAADAQLLREAYSFSATAHEGQKRQSGEPFLSHPLRVARIISRLKLDVSSIVAGLLHDTLEDCGLNREEVENKFGKEIAHLVDGVTKIGKIEFKTHEEKQAENFRKMILSMSEDIRVILIKLADRLHNMRTLEHLPEDKQRRIAQETLDIYAPLANRLGIGWMKTELEDLCFRYLQPETHITLIQKVAQRHEERERYVLEVSNVVKKNLAEYGFKAEVLGRPKNIYSIYQKMQKQGIPFEEVYDLAGVRIVTDTKMNCYGILGMIHSLWRPVPGRFKDYIGVSKSNGYQSLHTTVAGPRGQHVEFQIRTEEMHKVAEEGIASHWKYKEKGHLDPKLVEWQKDLTDNRQFLDSVKMDLFPDVVYVFTPKGEVKEIPKGSTPIDFAYSVHTEIGNHCAGAKVNGKLVSLRHILQTGDTVEVLTSSHQVPSKDWLKIVRSPRSKAKIKHWIKTEERKRSLDIGRGLLSRALQRHHLSPTETFKSPQMSGLAKDFGLSTLDDLLVAVGYGRISTDQVIHKLQPTEGLKEGLTEKLLKKIGIHERGVKVKGIGDLLVHLSKCCNPVPGDRIIGFITRGRGLSIHTLDCPNIDELDYDKDRLVEVSWDTQKAGTHPVKISVLTVDRPGLLASISASITSAKANISHAEITTTEDKKAILDFVVDVSNTAHLDKVLKNIQQVDGVILAKRVRRG
jgi:GTP diphosphokinase / guanosine-3',5'-bis(diphosphate) 3'-diphosphatase